MNKLLKVIVAMFLAIQLLMLSVCPFNMVYASDELIQYLELEKERRETWIPSIKMTSMTNIEIEAGTEKTIELLFKNVGGYRARNIVIHAISTDSDVPFVMHFPDRANEISSINGNVEIKVPLNIKVDAKSESKTYPITLEYTFFNDYKKEFEGKDTLYLKVQADDIEEDDDEGSPKLSLVDFKASPSTIAENSNGTITTILQNIGTASATDIHVTLDGLTSEAISIRNGSNVRIFNSLEPNATAVLSFDIVAAADMNTGNYPVVFKIVYKDSDKNDYSGEHQYFISVLGKATEEITTESKANVQLASISVPTATYTVGTDFKISLNVSNIGISEAKNVKITAKPADTVVVPKSASIQKLDSLSPEQSKSIEFLFAATSDAVSQNYVIEFLVEYEDGTKNSDDTPNIFSFSQFSGVNISNPKKDKEEEEEKEEEKEDDKSIRDVPKIIIQKYECDPIIVNAGSEFNLSMVYENTHSTKTVRNIKAFLTVNDTEEKTNASIFTPVNSSNTFYIDSIPPKGTVERTIRLYAIPDAQPITYSINVNFEYEDNDFNEFKATEYVGINVKQDAKLDMSAVALPTEAFIGQPISVFFEFYNVGKVTLSNLTIELEGDIDAATKKNFYGNLEAGYSEYYENTFFPMQPGELSGRIKISYEDPSGEQFEKIEEFSMSVMEDPMMGGDMMDIEAMNMGMEESRGGLFSNKVFLVFMGVGIFILVAGGIVTFILVRRHIRKRKGMTLDE